MRSVAILLLNGVMDSSLAITLDVLGAANRLGSMSSTMSSPLFEWKTLSPTGSQIWLGSGYQITVDAALTTQYQPDLIIVPGLGLSSDQLDSAMASSEFQIACQWLHQQQLSGTIVATSCSGTFLLAEAGLLNGRTVTTSWWLIAEFQRRYPKVQLREDLLVTEDGGIYCAGAAFAHLDLMLTLIRCFSGPAIADLCARYLVIDQRSSQVRYAVIEHLSQSNPDAIRAENWIRENMARSFSTQELASDLGFSTRTLHRRLKAATGLNPNQFIQRLRLDKALHLIQTTSLPLELIAEQVGYQDPVALRRLLRREMNTSFREIRKHH